MKFRYNINERSYVIVTEVKNGVIANHFMNGCSRNLMSRFFASKDDCEEWIVKMKKVYGNEAD